MDTQSDLTRRENRIWLALAVAAVVPAVVFGGIAPLSGVASVASIGLSVIALMPYSAAVVLGIGGPLYLLCAKFGLFRWWSSLLGGALGALAFSLLMAFPNQPSQQHLQISLAAGLLTGLAFWLLAARAKILGKEDTHEG